MEYLRRKGKFVGFQKMGEASNIWKWILLAEQVLSKSAAAKNDGPFEIENIPANVFVKAAPGFPRWLACQLSIAPTR